MIQDAKALVLIAAAGVLCTVNSSYADVTITRSSSAPTYDNVLTFDEVGGPTGSNLPTNSWSSYGITSIIGYSSGFASVVNLNTGGLPWAPNSNVLYSPWGLELVFAEPVSAVSFEGYSNGGNAGPFGGGTWAIALNGITEVANSFLGGAAWGGIGDAFYNIVATDGDQFTSIKFISNGSPFPEQFINSISWNTVPGPGATALLALAGVVGSRRRRS